MRRLFIFSVVFVAVASVFLIAGCSDDDDPVIPPESFQVVLEMVTPEGDPVAGLELGLAPDSPFYMDGKSTVEMVAPAVAQMGWPFPSPFNPSVVIPFTLAEPGWIRVVVEDIEGGLVRLLGERQADAGSHQWLWNGQDDDGARAPSGVYFAHLTLVPEDSGDVVLEDSKKMLLAVFYADQYLVGTTDDNGRIVLEDKKLFPYLYDVPNFPAMDETGSPMGAIILTPTTRFYFTDPAGGTTLRFDGDVAGATTLRFVWDPEP